MDPAQINVELPPEVKALGFPSFQEFCKNPDKWRNGLDQLCYELERGGDALKKIQDKVFFRFGKFKHRTLYACIQHMKNEGVSLAECEYRGSVEQVPGGKCDVVITFVPKLPGGLVAP